MSRKLLGIYCLLLLRNHTLCFCLVELYADRHSLKQTLFFTLVKLYAARRMYRDHYGYTSIGVLASLKSFVYQYFLL